VVKVVKNELNKLNIYYTPCGYEPRTDPSAEISDIVPITSSAARKVLFVIAQK